MCREHKAEVQLPDIFGDRHGIYSIPVSSQRVILAGHLHPKIFSQSCSQLLAVVALVFSSLVERVPARPSACVVLDVSVGDCMLAPVVPIDIAVNYEFRLNEVVDFGKSR